MEAKPQNVVVILLRDFHKIQYYADLSCESPKVRVSLGNR